MVHGAVRTLFQLLGALVMIIAISIPLIAWRLSAGPIAIQWLTPYIEEALSGSRGGLRVRLERTVLAWDSEGSLLDVRAQEVRAIVDGKTIASVPELSVALGLSELVRGRIAPHSVRLLKPRMLLVRTSDGELELGLGASDPEARRRFIHQLWQGLTDPKAGSPQASLTSVAVIGADLTFEDSASGVRVNFPTVDLRASREDGGVAFEASALAAFGETTRTTLRATALVRATSESLPVRFEFSGLRPSVLPPLLGAQPFIKAIDLDLNGTGSAVMNLQGAVDSVSLDVRMGKGVLRLPTPLANYPIASGQFSVKATEGLRQVAIEELRAELGGTTITASANAALKTSGWTVSGHSAVMELPVPKLKEYWPATLASSTRRWVVGNITDGAIRRATTEFVARSPTADLSGLQLESIRSVIDVQNAVVHYFGSMPPATAVNGQVVVDHERVAIRIDSGKCGGLAVPEASVLIPGLNRPATQTAEIQIKATGTVADALKLIDSKPLGYTSKLGLKPEAVGGTHASLVRLRVPLLDDLPLSALGVNVQADVSGLTLPHVLRDLDLSEGNFQLQVDTTKLDAVGSAQIGGIPSQLKWSEHFSGPGPRRSYQVSAVLDEKGRAILGLPQASHFISGPVPTEATIVFGDADHGQVDARFDLTKARLELPRSGWHKDPGRPGAGQVRLLLDKDGIADIPGFSVKADDLTLLGRASMTDGRVGRLEVQKLAYGRTDLSGTLHVEADGSSQVLLSGNSLDAAPLIKDARSEGSPDTTLPPLIISGQVGQLWISQDGALRSASLDLKRFNGDWRNVKIAGFAGEKPVYLQVQPQSDNNRRLSITSEDAGSVLRSLGIYDHLHGGKLDVRGIYEDDKPGRPLRGTAQIQDYTVTNAPTLARLLTIAALTGILDLLRGEGISFSSLEAPFTMQDGLIEVKDARAFGTALGITANGQLDLDHDRIAMEGTIVPAYALNSLIGNIPLIGRLLTGDKGSGIFAATYTARGRLEEPDVSVNPLATLAPGFLRKFFQIFTPDATKARPDGTGPESSREPLPMGPGRVD